MAVVVIARRNSCSDVLVRNRDFKCVQQRADDVVDTDEKRDLHQSLLSKSPLRGSVKSCVNTMLGRKLPCITLCDLTRLLAGLLAVWMPSAMGEGMAGGPKFEVSGTQFRITMPDGRVLTSPDLIGAVLDATDEMGRTIRVRLDALTRDPSDRDDDIWLHRFSVSDAGTGSWRDFCAPGPDGTVAGFPSGSWTKDGRHESAGWGFIITCTSGAVGKCVRMGYKPWRNLKGEALWDYHQACVRAVRADYGGDGAGHTRDGTLIDISDRLGIQRPEPHPRNRILEFEAAWGPNGAVCVRRTRIADLLSAAELAALYPHLADKIGPDCSEAVNALVWNRS
jgi:hypothetical protein